MQKKSGIKGASLTIASSIVVFGVQMMLNGEPMSGAIAIGISSVLFGAYSVYDKRDERKEIDKIVDEIGEDTFKRLAEVSSERLNELLKSVDQEN